MEEPEPTITREEIALRQAERLPQLAVQWLLHIGPTRAMSESAVQDALELSAAEVVESGREFASLSDREKRDTLTRNYEFCLDRNRRFLRLLEDQN